MAIHYVFAALAVADRDAAMAWYERLFGKPATFVPTETEAVWQLAATASLYVLEDPARAGRGIVTLAVDDLQAHLGELAARGITAGPVEEIPGAGRKAVVTDPDGNTVGLVEIRSSR